MLHSETNRESGSVSSETNRMEETRSTIGIWVSTFLVGLILLVGVGCGSTSPGSNTNNNTNANTNSNTNNAPPELKKPTTNPAPITQGCNVLVESVCVLPFPSSVFIKQDKTTPSGLSFAISKEADFGGLSEKLSVFKHDGYSTVNPISTQLPGGVDPNSLPKTYNESLAKDATVMIVNADPTSDQYGQRVPFDTQVFISENKKDELLVLTPLKAMSYGSRYAVIITDGVKNKNKEAHKPSTTMTTLLGEMPPEGKLKDWWTYYRDLHWLAVKELNIPKERIVQMWDFPIRSKESTTADLLAMARWTTSWLQSNPPQAKILETKEDGDNTIFTFSFDLPIWTPKEGVYPARDNNGVVKHDRIETTTAELILPKSATADKPVEILIFGHGLGSNRGNSVNQLKRLLKYKPGIFGAGAMDWDLHGSRGKGLSDILQTASNLDVHRFSSMFMQSAVDTMVFSKAIEALIQWPEIKGKARSPRFYVGQSMGGFVGTLASIIHPTLEAFVLNVAGGGMGNVMRKGAIGNEFGLRALTAGVLAGQKTQGLTEDLSVEFALQSSQMGLDPGDPISFAPFVLNNRWTSFRDKAPYILVQQSLNDGIVPNFSTNTLARTMGLSAILPFVTPIPGLDTAQAPTQGNPAVGLTQFRVTDNPTSAHTALSNKNLSLQILDYFSSFLQQNGTPGNIKYHCNSDNKPCDLLK
ncbi:MAG: hypothetical protein EP343_09190 [Deltaproteobacteria bacterium]|nr:MAG: hypothetical protein EP343_09190 [Deltaproteobacteria bacterium]